MDGKPIQGEMKLQEKNITLHNIEGFPVFLREGTPDDRVAKESLGTEFALICDLLSRVRHDNLVLDFGGYIGTAAMKFSASIPRSTVVSVEPAPDNFRMLTLNTACHSNIIALNAGVSSKPGTMNLLSRGTGEWGYTLIEKPRDTAEPDYVAEVSIMTVDMIIRAASRRPLPISFAKIDIEGSEVELLRDPSWVDDVAIVMAELHDRIVDGCTAAWLSVASRPGRISIGQSGEKVISVSPSLIRKLCS